MLRGRLDKNEVNRGPDEDGVGRSLEQNRDRSDQIRYDQVRLKSYCELL
jgi:hypothetical protein